MHALRASEYEMFSGQAEPILIERQWQEYRVEAGRWLAGNSFLTFGSRFDKLFNDFYTN